VRLALVIALLLGACNSAREPGAAKGAPNPRSGGTLRIAAKDAIVSIDPAYANDDASILAVHTMFDTLVGYEGTTLVPHLATRWEISDDGLVYTFELRDARYSDGTPIVAADFVAALARTATTTDAPHHEDLSNVASQVAVDAKTLRITLATPNEGFLFVLAMPFTAPQPNGVPKSSGPFHLASWDRGQKIVFERSATYWNPEHAKLERIELRENVPTEMQFLLLEAGELDATERVSAADYVWLAGEPTWAPLVRRAALLSAFGARLYTRAKPFDDVRVRRAMNHCTNKDHITRLLYGSGIAAHGVLPPGLLGHDPTLAPYRYDPVKGRALLAAAGYPEGLDLEYVLPADEEAARLAESLQADLLACGVRVKLAMMAASAYATALVDTPARAPFAQAGWIDAPDPAVFLDPLFHSEGSSNWSAYSNPALDAVLEQARATKDRDARGALYRTAERIVYDDAPWIFGYHQALAQVVQPYVKNYAPHPVWQRDFTAAWVDK